MKHIRQPKVLIFPRDPNPYQELLYGPMRRAGMTADYLPCPTRSQTLNLLCFSAVLLYKRLRGYNILHVHWTYTFTLPWARRAGGLAMQMLAAGTWIFARWCGYRIVWTAHNVLPHEPQFFDDAVASRRLASAASVVIAHTSAAREQLQAIGAGDTPIRIIPHGSYVDVYPHTVTRFEARQQLHIPHSAPVILCFGIIRPSKGVEQLLEAYHSLSDADKQNLTLVFAGAPINSQLVRALRTAQRRAGKRIKLVLKHIPDDEVQLYFSAADFAVLPYQCSTTSGVALLAFSFGCPIIAPNMAAFSDLPNAAQILFDDDRLSYALRDALHTSPARRQRMSKAAQEYADALSWNVISRKTRKVFAALVS